MPKDTNKSPYKSPNADPNNAAKVADIALRKKKNADAQAAFRARRANYITTLEETVTNLENVVMQLQDSVREARAEVNDLHLENQGLREQMRTRDKQWKTLLASRKSSGTGAAAGQQGDLPLQSYIPPPPLSAIHTRTLGNTTSTQYSQLDQFSNGGSTTAASVSSNGAYAATSGMQDYSQHQNHSSTPLAYGAEEMPSGSSSMGHRAARYSPYTYPVPSSGSNTTRGDGSWSQHQQTIDSTASGMTTPGGGSSHSSFTDSSNTIASTTDMNYVGRLLPPPPPDQKISGLHQLDTAPYVFQQPNNQDSTSPSTSPSSSSTSLTSPFNQYPPYSSDNSNAMHRDHRSSEYAYHHRRPHAPGGEDVSLAGPGSDAVRYRLGLQRPHSGGHQHHSPTDGSGGSPQEDDRPLDSRRSINPLALPPSRSPSPSDTPPLSGTLAVLKAQAFGALRRTRCRTKKSGAQDGLLGGQMAKQSDEDDMDG